MDVALGLGGFGGCGFGVPVVRTGQEGCREILPGFGWGELVGPGDAGGGVCAGAGGVRFGVVGGLVVGGIVPVVPAGGVEIGGEFGVEVDDLGVRAPWAAEGGSVVSGGGAFCAGDGGVLVDA